MAERPITLVELVGAIFRGYHNELALDEKRGLNDPVKFRFGGWDDPGSEYIATLSFDVLEGNDDVPTRREKGFIGLLLDPDPCIDLFLQRTKETTEDRDMVRIARFSASGVEFFVPVAGLGGGSDGRFYTTHQGRRLCFNPQADPASLGAIVVYDTMGTTDESQWKPIGIHQPQLF